MVEMRGCPMANQKDYVKAMSWECRWDFRMEKNLAE
jgi:hypothetical protein